MIYEKNKEWFIDHTDESGKVIHTHGPYATQQVAEDAEKAMQASKQEKPL